LRATMPQQGLDFPPIKDLAPLDGPVDTLDCNDLLLHHLCCSGVVAC
jgi:hypothetical protein